MTFYFRIVDILLIGWSILLVAACDLQAQSSDPSPVDEQNLRRGGKSISWRWQASPPSSDILRRRRFLTDDRKASTSSGHSNAWWKTMKDLQRRTTALLNAADHIPLLTPEEKSHLTDTQPGPFENYERPGRERVTDTELDTASLKPSLEKLVESSTYHDPYFFHNVEKHLLRDVIIDEGHRPSKAEIQLSSLRLQDGLRNNASFSAVEDDEASGGRKHREFSDSAYTSSQVQYVLPEVEHVLPNVEYLHPEAEDIDSTHLNRSSHVEYVLPGVEFVVPHVEYLHFHDDDSEKQDVPRIVFANLPQDIDFSLLDFPKSTTPTQQPTTPPEDINEEIILLTNTTSNDLQGNVHAPEFVSSPVVDHPSNGRLVDSGLTVRNRRTHARNIRLEVRPKIGQPNVDYPAHQTLPIIEFHCDEQPSPGYYADVNARCQVFHICHADGRRDSFLCPVGTVFNQQYLVCDWWYNVDCERVFQHYRTDSYQAFGTRVQLLQLEPSDVIKKRVNTSSSHRLTTVLQPIVTKKPTVKLLKISQPTIRINDSIVLSNKRQSVILPFNRVYGHNLDLLHFGSSDHAKQGVVATPSKNLNSNRERSLHVKHLKLSDSSPDKVSPSRVESVIHKSQKHLPKPTSGLNQPHVIKFSDNFYKHPSSHNRYQHVRDPYEDKIRSFNNKNVTTTQARVTKFRYVGGLKPNPLNYVENGYSKSKGHSREHLSLPYRRDNDYDISHVGNQNEKEYYISSKPQTSSVIKIVPSGVQTDPKTVRNTDYTRSSTSEHDESLSTEAEIPWRQPQANGDQNQSEDDYDYITDYQVTKKPAVTEPYFKRQTQFEFYANSRDFDIETEGGNNTSEDESHKQSTKQAVFEPHDEFSEEDLEKGWFTVHDKISPTESYEESAELREKFWRDELKTTKLQNPTEISTVKLYTEKAPAEIRYELVNKARSKVKQARLLEIIDPKAFDTQLDDPLAIYQNFNGRYGERLRPKKTSSEYNLTPDSVIVKVVEKNKQEDRNSKLNQRSRSNGKLQQVPSQIVKTPRDYEVKSDTSKQNSYKSQQTRNKTSNAYNKQRITGSVFRIKDARKKRPELPLYSKSDLHKITGNDTLDSNVQSSNLKPQSSIHANALPQASSKVNSTKGSISKMPEIKNVRVKNIEVLPKMSDHFTVSVRVEEGKQISEKLNKSDSSNTRLGFKSRPKVSSENVKPSKNYYMPPLPFYVVKSANASRIPRSKESNNKTENVKKVDVHSEFMVTKVPKIENTSASTVTSIEKYPVYFHQTPSASKKESNTEATESVDDLKFDESFRFLNTIRLQNQNSSYAKR